MRRQRRLRAFSSQVMVACTGGSLRFGVFAADIVTEKSADLAQIVTKFLSKSARLHRFQSDPEIAKREVEVHFPL